jgi:hypothetical protein
MSVAYKSALAKAMPYNIYKTSEGETSAGQKYTIIINSMVWYKVRLFLEENHLDKGRTLTEYHWSQHTTREGANEAARWIHERLQRTPLLEFTPFESDSVLTYRADYYFAQVKMSDECKIYPDKYLKKGDHVYITRKCGIYHHDCIYLGNRRVVHINGDMSNIAEVKAKEDKWENFVGYYDDGSVSWFGTIYVIVYRLTIRNPDEICEVAQKLASKAYAKGDYNFVLKNCQHFASFCCTGKEISLGSHSVSDWFIQGLKGLTRKPPVGSAIAKTVESPLDKEP